MNHPDDRALILVIEDVEEIRDGIEKLLHADGYRVDPARDEEDAATLAARESPDLLLMSSGARRAPTISTVRQQLGLSEKVPVVVFCGDTIAEGTEQQIGTNAYLSRPDNFNQLRNFLRRLLEPDASDRASLHFGAPE
jgi:DNA-binding response OmpR family regulator